MKKNLSVAALGSLLMIVVMRFQGSSLKTTTSPRGIIDLEFANTPQRLHELLLRWDISVVKMNIWLDFLFIVSYVLFLSIAAGLCAEKWPERSVPRQAGLFFAKITYVAGILDIAENLLMLQSIQGNFTDVSLQLTFYCAAVKFILAALILIYLVGSIPFVIRKK
jgi:hypothetical protein